MKFVVLLCLLMMAVTIIDSLGNGRGKGGLAKAPSKTRSEVAGLVFPVARVHRFLRKGHYGYVGSIAPVYLTAVLEYVTREILKLAIKAAHDDKKSTIIPRHVQLAVRNDEELNKLLGGVIIAEGGVRSNIHETSTKTKAGVKGETKRKRKRPEVYGMYIHNVLKQINPDVIMSSKAMSIMNSFIYNILEHLAPVASRLSLQKKNEGKKEGIKYRDFQTAVFQIFPEELAKHADSEGTKAVTKYMSS